MPFDVAGFEKAAEPDKIALGKIDAVIDLLATEDRWCKGYLKSPDGRHCIRGAMHAVGAAELLKAPVLDAIREVGGRRFRRIESFNDHPDTSHEQVLKVLHLARDRLSPVVAANVSSNPVLERRSVLQTFLFWR